MQQDHGDTLKASEETASRKDSHIDLALVSQNGHTDPRFYYEPFLSAHPQTDELWETFVGSKKMNYPIWISSMTGGTERSNEINRRLAQTVQKFGLGMGVGSVRIAVENPAKEKDFDLRKWLGDEAPFYLNFGIAQVEKFLQQKEIYKLIRLREKLSADGFIIHVNPLQEWMQPEGDRIEEAPVRTIEKFLVETAGAPLIVKEVGQGFGYESMKALLQLPLTAIEFAAAGGTNFSKVELNRNEVKSRFLSSFVQVGHTAGEMVAMLNSAIHELEEKRKCNTAIISGGIKNFLDGYYYIQQANINALYGQASVFLRQALLSQEALDEFTKYQVEGLLLARAYLKIKEKQ